MNVNRKAFVSHLVIILVAGWILIGSGLAYSRENKDTEVADLSTVGVLDLETAQRIALASNPTMGAAMARVKQARARVRQAAATWWPSVDLTASGGRTRMSETAWQESQALASLYGRPLDRTNEEYTAGLQATWILFDGFYRSFNQEQAGFGEESAAAAQTDARRLLAAAVAEAFLNAQLAQTNHKIAEADRDFYTQQLGDAQNRFDVGAGPWGDVLNIKVQLNSAKTRTLLAAREFEAAGYGLAALLGIPDAEFPEAVTLEELGTRLNVQEKTDPAQQLIAEALEQRPDISQLALRVKQAKAGSGMAQSRFYPRIQLAGAYNGARQGDMGLSGDDFGNSIFLNLSWNLFSGGADRARSFEAEQAGREAQYALVNLRNQVAAEVRQGITLLEAAREQVLLQRDSVSLVQENRELARNAYEAGEASLVRLNEAQRDLTATFARLAQAQVAFSRARQRLLAATGRNIIPFAVPASQP